MGILSRLVERLSLSNPPKQKQKYVPSQVCAVQIKLDGVDEAVAKLDELREKARDLTVQFSVLRLEMEHAICLAEASLRDVDDGEAGAVQTTG